MENGKWKAKLRKIEGNNDQENLDGVYDAVVVCNRHYTEHRLAIIPGNSCLLRIIFSKNDIAKLKIVIVVDPKMQEYNYC